MLRGKTSLESLFHYQTCLALTSGLRSWDGRMGRPTKQLDLLQPQSSSAAGSRKVFQDILSQNPLWRPLFTRNPKILSKDLQKVPAEDGLKPRELFCLGRDSKGSTLRPDCNERYSSLDAHEPPREQGNGSARARDPPCAPWINPTRANDLLLRTQRGRLIRDESEPL